MNLAAKILVGIALVFAAGTGSLFAKAPADDVLKVQHSYFDAILVRKYDVAVDLLAPDYRGVYADGIIDREKEVKDLHEFPLTEYKMSEEKVTFPAPTVALVTFRLHVKVTVDGKDFFEDDNLSCVWHLQKKKWQMVSQAAVKIPANK